jgi:hypothetical protein
MNASINIHSNPKLLTHPGPLVLTVVSGNVPEPRRGLESLPFCTIENIQLRAETVTPTLQGILDHWPSEHRDSNL